jgi:hypothetical protein
MSKRKKVTPSLDLRHWSCIVGAQVDLADVTTNAVAEVRAVLLEGWHGQLHCQARQPGSHVGNCASLVAQASSPALSAAALLIVASSFPGG